MALVAFIEKTKVKKPKPSPEGVSGAAFNPAVAIGLDVSSFLASSFQLAEGLEEDVIPAHF